MKVRQPLEKEVEIFRPGSTLISFMYPAQNMKIIEQLAAKEMTVFGMTHFKRFYRNFGRLHSLKSIKTILKHFSGMDCVPRISRAQVRH